MKRKLRILHLEDLPADAELVKHELEKGGLEFGTLLVDNKQDYLSALREYSPDLILSDHSLLMFDSHEALLLFKEMKMPIPFILVSATATEEFAIKIMKAGADDYILKDRLQRLPSAVIQSLEKWQVESDRLIFLDKVAESERLLKKTERLACVGSWDADLRTGHIKCSDECLRIFGYEPDEIIPTYQLVLKHIHSEDLKSTKKRFEDIVAHRASPGTTFRIINRHGNVKYLHSEIVVKPDHNNEVITIHGFIQDISEIKNKELELVASEKRYRKIVETAQEGIWVIDELDKTTFVNQKMCEILGYSPAEMLGKENVYFMDDEGKAIATKAMERRRQGVRESIDIKYMTKSGKPVWTHISANPILAENGKYAGALAMVTDITDSKLAKDKLVRSEIQVRNFAKHLNQVQEEERSYIAREIHDELGQQLAGIKMGLSFLRTNYEANAEIEDITDSLLKDVDTTIQSLRKIATELRPGILDTMGLLPSIHWLAKEFEKKMRITCTIETTSNESVIEKSIATCYFRICQEAFTNISKHSKATQVKITVHHNTEVLTLKITDNGIGIAGDKLDNPFSMGLLGMQERANLIGGILFIRSKEGAGTTIQLTTKLPE